MKKKLVLKKIVITALNDKEQENVHGGMPPPTDGTRRNCGGPQASKFGYYTCDTCLFCW